MNLTDRINEVIDGLTGNPAAHQWIADLEDIRAGVDELTAAAWACTQAKQDRAADVAELVEAAGDYYTGWAQDEADDVDYGIGPVCGPEQHKAAKRLRAALAAMGWKA